MLLGPYFGINWSIHLSSFFVITFISFQILARCCPNLKKLALRGCELVGDDGLEAVAYYCRGLTQLNIQDTPVTLRGYRAVKKYCKRCVIEHTNPGFC